MSDRNLREAAEKILTVMDEGGINGWAADMLHDARELVLEECIDDPTEHINEDDPREDR